MLRDIPHKAVAIIPDRVFIKSFGAKFCTIKTGWTIKPTARSETARPHSKIIEERERRKEEVKIAVNTNMLPQIAASISGTLMTQFTMAIVELEDPEEFLNTVSFMFKAEGSSEMKCKLRPEVLLILSEPLMQVNFQSDILEVSLVYSHLPCK